ncbi:hypothetical protein V6N13_127550 [Hibiscus sabdariffa]
MAQVGGVVMLQPEVGGDTLVMRMTLIKLQKRFGIAKMEGKAYVGGDLVCEDGERTVLWDSMASRTVSFMQAMEAPCSLFCF